jgi:hypothetical protein
MPSEQQTALLNVINYKLGEEIKSGRISSTTDAAAWRQFFRDSGLNALLLITSAGQVLFPYVTKNGVQLAKSSYEVRFGQSGPLHELTGVKLDDTHKVRNTTPGVIQQLAADMPNFVVHMLNENFLSHSENGTALDPTIGLIAFGLVDQFDRIIGEED